MNDEKKDLTLEESLKIVSEIGLRFEKQQEIESARARADRQRKILREAEKTNDRG